MKRVFLLSFVSALLAPAAAMAQFDTDSDCGAAGYACLNGRHCSGQRCLPAWQDISVVGAPAGAIGGAVENLGGKIAVFGGCSAEQQAGDFPSSPSAVYDPSSDSWTPLDAPLVSRQYAFSASGNGGVYLFGGLAGCYWPYDLPNSLEFVTPAGTWADVSGEIPWPSGRYYGSMVWTGDSLLMYGGSDDYAAAKSDGGRFFPGLGWDVFELEGYQQRGGQYDLVVDGGSVRVLGGLQGYGNAPQALTYDLTTDLATEWSMPDGPVFDQEICAPAAGGDVDGLGRSYYLSLDGGVWAYSTVGGVWSFDPDLPPSLNACAPAAWSGGELFAWSGDGSQYGARYQPPAP